MADMMKMMGGANAKRGMMGKLGQMMGLGGGMPMPTPEQIEAMQKKVGGAAQPPGLPSGPPGIPAAPPPGAFNLPPQFPGLGGGPEAAGPGRGLQPVRGEEEVTDSHGRFAPLSRMRERAGDETRDPLKGKPECP